jgi:hypothetical protein
LPVLPAAIDIVVVLPDGNEITLKVCAFSSFQCSIPEDYLIIVGAPLKPSVNTTAARHHSSFTRLITFSSKRILKRQDLHDS